MSRRSSTGLLMGAALISLACAGSAFGQESPHRATVFAAAKDLQPKVVAWRRDIHQHPELGNREFRTSALVAEHLRALGYEVKTGVAHTGVVATLKGGKPGGVVALRADMDALPVEEKTGLPFASKVVGEYNGQPTPVMHACGHDAHVAILMGAAEVLAGMREDIAGTVVLIFQPAEEGPPPGEDGGAAMMIAEGALANPKPGAIFGLHVSPGDVGAIAYRSGPMMAAADSYEIRIKGKQTHGARPWDGIDLASLSAEIVQAFNQIAARRLDVARSPTVITVAVIQSGVRHNIIPEDMMMGGTLRTFDPEMRTATIAQMQAAVDGIVARYGAEGSLTLGGSTPVVSNDADLARLMAPTLLAAASGPVNAETGLITGAEDFADFQAVVPGLFYRLGVGYPPGTNHSPFFTIDEAALEVGVRAQVLTALDYLDRTAGGPAD
ncbi:MAG: amidohydrolase [Phenylobacterium sp.]|uniref:amidohydrolase n=1 Tax=Phenylobacterium sp. TaxID=1871053 RepID=UPI00271FDAD0|nr:amidohydrolase [Phenylobacterium sp.]MDO8901292.1 amidohydrolase [Phenylobacterium sp.]